MKDYCVNKSKISKYLQNKSRKSCQIYLSTSKCKTSIFNMTFLHHFPMDFNATKISSSSVNTFLMMYMMKNWYLFRIGNTNYCIHWIFIGKTEISLILKKNKMAAMGISFKIV